MLEHIKEKRIIIENRLKEAKLTCEAELRELQKTCPHKDVFSIPPDDAGSFIWHCNDCGLRRSCL